MPPVILAALGGMAADATLVAAIVLAARVAIFAHSVIRLGLFSGRPKL